MEKALVGTPPKTGRTARAVVLVVLAGMALLLELPSSAPPLKRGH
jgi:hypothetical protein